MTENRPPQFSGDERTLMHRLEQVENLSKEGLDELPFGVIQVDRDGVVLAYNAAEARLADMDPNDVVGRNFFTDVAPCTNVKEFGERFRNGMTRGRIHDTFPFNFSFLKGPVNVIVTIHYDSPAEHAWIFVDLGPEAAQEAAG